MGGSTRGGPGAAGDRAVADSRVAARDVPTRKEEVVASATPDTLIERMLSPSDVPRDFTMSSATVGEPAMAYGHTFGPAIDPVTRLGWGLGVTSLAVIAVIGALLVGSLVRGRGPVRAHHPRELAVSHDAGGMAWIYVGVGVSSLVLVACLVWTLIVTAAVSRPPAPGAVTVQVTAAQWWWRLRYDSPEPSRTFTTANEIHIPVGRPVRFELASADVIHSFWIPQLAGKMDVIPGQTNVTWLQADHAGSYRGQCAAFCGAQHAHMALLVVAESPETFAAWQRRQLVDVTPLRAADAQGSGERIFETRCATCHTIRGLVPAGVVGPDLSHLMMRTTIAAGLLPNSPVGLASWIADPQSLKPGTRMPAPHLSEPELVAVTSYLGTLR